MARKKKHSKAEVASKLAQADELAEQGKLQSEIAHTLGVSVMTLHRWRKGSSAGEPRPGPRYEASTSDPGRDQENRIADLQLENSRLRRLVTDLLLEKMKLEEAAQKSSTKRASS
jgi:putative transposase